MRLLLMMLAVALYACGTQPEEQSQGRTATDTTQGAGKVAQPQPDTFAIISKGSTIPGEIDSSKLARLPEHLRAVAAFYAAMGGTMCDYDYCELTTALGLGRQGSEKHKALIAAYFPGDKVAATVIRQDCYLRPSGASSFSDFESLSIIDLGDTIKVDYRLFYYNRGEESWASGPDVYLFSKNQFTKLKRNIWKHSDE